MISALITISIIAALVVILAAIGVLIILFALGYIEAKLQESGAYEVPNANVSTKVLTKGE